MMPATAEARIPAPPSCPAWCTSDHVKDAERDSGQQYLTRQHLRHFDAVRIEGIGYFDVYLFAYDHLWVGVTGTEMTWGQDKHERPVIDLSVPRSSDSIKLQSKAELIRFLSYEAFMYRPVVEQVREAGRLLGWEAPSSLPEAVQP